VDKNALPQTLTDIKQLLAAHGLRPKHRLGQNFLHDGNHMARIMDAAEVGDGDVVLEVGPGTGALTERLIEAGAAVVAVEIDPDLEPILRQRLDAAGDQFTLIFGDILAGKHRLNPAVLEALEARATAPQIPTPTPNPPSPTPTFKLIANLPYQVASPLLANLVADHPAMTDAVVMIQKEVADRLTAAPGSKAYGPLGILLQALCDIRVVGVLPPSCFWPPPKVASAVVHLQRRAEPGTDDPAALSRTLQKVFRQRRKQLGSILGRDTPLPTGVESTARPESLTVEQLIALSRRLGDAPPKRPDPPQH
jgi:16S rRNA (adenine1518-N6/adenine1519-N6)-dimethyltransferase